MGFFIMIISMLIGIFLIAFGISHRKSKYCYKISIALGTVLILLAIYLGFPK
ncbi:hypothetical protein [Hathewaya limosa]|uniref:ABC-type tungstate transport system substrate-binding protein n=1 Tax=Hathewaya limosa TaxID=1536 RepID=A0ABU0JT54_HATLI|nr:hypothetical protein [Hathewaya limosa]MDQ0480274.1 ABC-type tungstate transport system substrate-binding protein [Hathewaya limosa]